MNTLARTLRACARGRRLSSVELARALGLSKSGLNLILTGKREFGLRALRGVARAFPELDSEILDYLRNGHDAD